MATRPIERIIPAAAGKDDATSESRTLRKSSHPAVFRPISEMPEIEADLVILSPTPLGLGAAPDSRRKPESGG